LFALLKKGGVGMSKDFIVKVRVELARYDKTQNWLAETIGISKTYMSDIMNGRRKPDKQIKPIETALEQLKNSH
jgi:DNA-binding XRE family transcriptional regulator